MEAGRLLIQAKDQVGHGGWLRWLKANTSVSERTAQYYMKLARDPSKSAIIADLTLDGALKLLGTPKADPEATDRTQIPPHRPNPPKLRCCRQSRNRRARRPTS